MEESITQGIVQAESLWATEALNLLAQGEFSKALVYLNLCLDEKYDKKKAVVNGDGDGSDGSKKSSSSSSPLSEVPTNNGGICPADEVSLLEKRCLIHMKLQNFDEVLNDARRILDKRTDHSLAYKCLLVALCKTNRLEPVSEILKLWRSYSPHDLDMMQCRTKLEALMLAVKNGIEPSAAFTKVEDQLGLSYDWLIARKPRDPLWRYRSLPPGQNAFALCLPFRFGHCSLGEKCPDAHGEGELEEWKNRSTLKSIALLLDSIKLDSGEMYIRKTLDKLREAAESTSVLSEVLPDEIKIKNSNPLETVVEFKAGISFLWTFAIESKKPLTHICLLHEIHRQYFNITSAQIYGANSKIDLLSGKSSENTQVVEISSPTALALTEKKSGFTYKVDVAFKPDVFGTFRQTVVFDIGEDLKFARNLTVDVVPAPEKENEDGESESQEDSSVEKVSTYRQGGSWNYGNADMVDSFTADKVASHKLGFQLINGMNKQDMLMSSLTDPLTKDNYKEKMRFFLTQEERARQEILAKYNLTTPMTLMEMYTMTSGHNDGLTKYALDGSLYGKMTLFRDVSEDTAVGRLILRSCNYLLLTKTEEARKVSGTAKTRVYLCPISDKTKNDIYIDVGSACVRELNLKPTEAASFDIQFQLDRTAFTEMKAVIDKLEEFHLDMLFPDFNFNYHIPWSPIKQWGDEVVSNVRLNTKQREALIAITTETDKIPPILVIGPFGTGKTFSLAQCIRKLLTQPNIRIMVCTHSNSAADLYIKEYLHPWVEEGFTAAKPLRIYYHMRNINSVHVDVLDYCKIEKLRFRPPTLEEILAHRVIVVTLSTSYMLMNMDLPKDTFSHILLDEAAQAMESEAITPLMSAGPTTKLVLAGDHMQLSPELFSDEAKSLHPSLLERLHNSYPDNHPCKLMLCENYRSHTAIIEYVSEAFYSKKLQCSMAQPVHDTFFPMTFFAARGEEVQEQDSTSYFNMAEVFEVADKVAKLISSWPEKWGSSRAESAIGVLTPYSDQVSRIRSALRKKGMYSVSVERVLNVQGKQFRAVFLSTVRSFRPWVKILPEAVGNEVDLGFFSNPKLLNTALTRAQSLVAVVGDPVSLCSEGKCRNLWKDFITICNQNKSLYGMSYTQLEQSIAGLEMRMNWGFNPLAEEFQPRSAPKTVDNSGVIKMKGQVLTRGQSANQQQQHAAAPPNPNRGHHGPAAPMGQPPAQSHSPQIQQQQQMRLHQPKQPAGHPPPTAPFQNPGAWPPNAGGGPRPPVVHIPPTAPPNFPYRPYPFPGGPPMQGPGPGPNQVGYPTGFPPRQGIIPPQPPVAAVAAPPPPFMQSYLPQRHASEPAFPVKVQHPPQSMMGNYPGIQPQQMMANKSASHLSNSGMPPGSPILGRNIHHQTNSLNGSRSPMQQQMSSIMNAAGVGIGGGQNVPFHQQFPDQQQQDHFTSELPLYRRQPPQIHQQPQIMASNHQNLNSSLIFPNMLQQNAMDTRNVIPPPMSSPPAFSREELQLLNEMLENLSASNNPAAVNQLNEAQMLQSKLREAVSIARDLNETRGGGGFPNLAQDHNQQQQLNDFFAPQQASLLGGSGWQSNSNNAYSPSRMAAMNEQINDCRIAETVNDIWSSLGLNDDDPIPLPKSPERLNDNFGHTQNSSHNIHNHQNTFGGGFMDASVNQMGMQQMQQQPNYTVTNAQIESFLGATNNPPTMSRSTSDMDPWALNSSISSSMLDSHHSQQNQSLGPGFRSEAAGLMSSQQESRQTSSDAPGRSYANVVKRAQTSSAGPTSSVGSLMGQSSIPQGVISNEYAFYLQQQELQQQQAFLQDAMKQKNKK